MQIIGSKFSTLFSIDEALSRVLYTALGSSSFCGQIGKSTEGDYKKDKRSRKKLQ